MTPTAEVDRWDTVREALAELGEERAYAADPALNALSSLHAEHDRLKESTKTGPGWRREAAERETALEAEIMWLRDERGDLLWVLNFADSLATHEPCEECPTGSAPDECPHTTASCVHCALQLAAILTPEESTRITQVQEGADGEGDDSEDFALTPEED